MDLNQKQTTTILKALQIASYVAKTVYSHQAITALFFSPGAEKEKVLSLQATTVEAAEEFDALIPDFKELANRYYKQQDE